MSESDIAELEALRDADFVGLPREALVASIHDLAEQLLVLRTRISNETMPRLIEMENGDVRMRAALNELAELGNEKWKQPGHPMNDWVPRDRVNRVAKQGLGLG